MKSKFIRYAAFILLIGLAVEIVFAIKIAAHNQRMKSELEEGMKTNEDLTANPENVTNTTKSLNTTNQISK